MNWSACIENSHFWFVPDFYYIIIIFLMLLLLLNNCFFSGDSHFPAVKFESLDICIKLMVYGFLFYFHLFSICFAYNQLMLLAMSILRTLCVWDGGMGWYGCSCKCWWKTMPKHSPNMSQKSRQISLFSAKPLVHLIALCACENRHFKYCACIIIRNYGGVDRWLLRECDHILAQSFHRCSNVCNLFTSFVWIPR